jgi:hypothetical protein
MTDFIYREAIERTEAIIRGRAKSYRLLVALTAATAVLATIGAAWLGLRWLLYGSLILIPVCGLFLVSDVRRVNTWRHDCLKPWIDGRLDLAPLCAAIRAHPLLPPETTTAMLGTLPTTGDAVVEHRISIPTRRAIAVMAVATHRLRHDALALKAGGSALASFFVVLAIALGRWEPIVGLITLSGIPAVRAWMCRKRLAECSEAVAACRREVEFSEADYARLLPLTK